MSDLLATIGDGLGNAFQMAWEVWWALVLGFMLSGIVQAWVTRGQMERVLGGRGLAATLKATGLGAASSSCSYAAVAIAKSTFQKGAGLPAALAFMFASTNLVFELGIVLWIFLGPAFTAAEFAGGLVLILLMWAAVRLVVSRGEEEEIRIHAQEAQTGHQHAIASGRRPLREQLSSVQAWSDVAHNFRGDWQMLWKEIIAGFLIAGFIALVPMEVFNALFLTDAPGAVRTLENVVVGPVIAVLSFVCSIGNVPLAAVLWAGGISFAGVIAFIYADLITLPLLIIYRKYYGRRFALKLLAIMFATMVAASLAVDLLFSAAGLVPESRPSIESITDRGISLNYTAVLNVLFTVIGAALVWLTVRRGATDPVCGMQVDRYATEHRLEHAGHKYFFCSGGCREGFESDPERYAHEEKGTLGWRPRGLLRERS
ncbi:MAG: permease [Actinomycetota bacterium]|nr:permease [Actinomycetota bacterium]